MMNDHLVERWQPYFWWLLWALLAAGLVFSLSGYSEFDANKYINIAHTMQQTKTYLIPHWQQQIYTDKPPLFFWLFIIGWHFFGNNTFWPQLLVILFSSATLMFTQQVARTLWPRIPTISIIAPLILLATWYWGWLAKEIRVDALLTCFTLAAYYQLLKGTLGKKTAWWYYSLSITGGIMAKGPIILLLLTPSLLTLPWISTLQTQKKYKHLYIKTFQHTLLGCILPIVWLIILADKSHISLMQTIFYRQIVERGQQHHLGYLFYITRLPLWFLPWTIYLPIWRGVKCLLTGGYQRIPKNTKHHLIGLYNCLLYILPNLLFFSLYGEKLPHYLLPLFPFMALIFGFLCYAGHDYTKKPVGHAKHKDQCFIGLLYIIVGGLLLLLPYVKPFLPAHIQLTLYFLNDIYLLWPISLFMAGFVLCIVRAQTLEQQILRIAAFSLPWLIFFTAYLPYNYRQHTVYKSRALITRIKAYKKLQLSTFQLVQIGTLPNPIVQQFAAQHHAIQKGEKEIAAWLAKQPHGCLLSGANAFTLAQKQRPLSWFYATRNQIIAVWCYDGRAGAN